MKVTKSPSKLRSTIKNQKLEMNMKHEINTDAAAAAGAAAATAAASAACIIDEVLGGRFAPL